MYITVKDQVPIGFTAGFLMPIEKDMKKLNGTEEMENEMPGMSNAT